MSTDAAGRISVFCSYAREDEGLRRTVQQYLEPLRREYLIEEWNDGLIEPGAHWNEAIAGALDRSRLVLFIVTPDLMASQYVAEVEIPRAVERELRGECQVLPIMARKTAWESSPLAQFQAVPGGGRWLGEYADQAAAMRTVAEGVRAACRRVVDWTNPYRRSQVGDWTHAEQTMTVAGGQSISAQGTEELVAKTREQATLLLEIALPGGIQQRTVTIDLTQPIDDRMGDIMRQTGTDLPPNLEFSVGPAHYDEDVVNVGVHRYRTICSRRSLTLTQRDQRVTGWASIWRSLDVPLFGVVKGEGELGGFMRQRQVLLDHGRGDAATRKPRLGVVPAGSQPWQPMPAAPMPTPPVPPVTPVHAFGPGRWLVVMNAMGAIANYDLVVQPDGALYGRVDSMGATAELQGQWRADPASNAVEFQTVTSMMGMPVSTDAVQVWFSGANGPYLFAQDAMGRQYQFQRIG